MGKDYIDSLKEVVSKNKSFISSKQEKVSGPSIIQEGAEYLVDESDEFDMETSLEQYMMFESIAGTATLGAIAAAPLIVWAHKKYQDIWGRANSACANLGGKEGAMCRKQYKIKAAKAEIQALRYARSQCGKATDRKQCLDKINAKLKELKQKYPETQFKDD
jgi:hypothetical protein